MQKDDVIRLKHMLDAAKEAIGFCQVSISKEIKNDCPEIPWQEIIGMRNRLIHAYFTINLNILWKTVIEDLPP